jgi:death-on-curing protein
VTLFLTVEQVIRIHDVEAKCALLDRGKLESAVGQPAQTWDGQALYPTLLEQAAALLFCILNAHAFEDGNKRCAWLACTTFLNLNGVDFADVDQHVAADFVAQVAKDSLTIRQVVEQLIAWV